MSYLTLLIKKGFWSIQWRHHQGRSRRFGFTFEELSCCPSWYTVWFKQISKHNCIHDHFWVTLNRFLGNKTPMIPQYFIARHFNNRINLWIRLVVGEFYLFAFAWTDSLFLSSDLKWRLRTLKKPTKLFRYSEPQTGSKPSPSIRWCLTLTYLYQYELCFRGVRFGWRIRMPATVSCVRRSSPSRDGRSVLKWLTCNR